MKNHSRGGQKGEISSPTEIRQSDLNKKRKKRRLEVVQKEKPDNENLNRK